jgi:FkbM family methyltransferase
MAGKFGIMNATAPASLKHQAQGFLKRIGWYERLKASRMYDLYWSFADPHWIKDRMQEEKFYRTVLSGFKRGDVIFDIGANEGCKTDIFLRLGARVVSVEPDESNVEIIRGKFLKNRIFRKPVTVEAKAVSDRIGSVPMFVQAPGSALNTLSPKWAKTLKNDDARFSQHLEFAAEKTVETTTIENLIAQYGVPFYIKIDVEGHEVNVIRGLKRPVPFLSFEVNLPEFKEEGLECIRLLGGLVSDGEFNYSSDCGAGLEFSSWMPRHKFLDAFNECKKSSVEIFWRTRESGNGYERD